MEIFAFVDFLGAKFAGQDLAGELRGGGHGKIAREGNHQQRVQSGLGQQGFFLLKRRNQFGSHVGSQNAQRMGLEGDGDGPAAGFASAPHQFPQYLLMPAVDAVKIADTDHRRPQVAGDFRE